MIEIFNEYNVKYLIVGAYAMSTFGYSRSTFDIDLWVGKDDNNARKVLSALDEFGVPFDVEIEDLTKDNSIIQIGQAPVRIDILTDIDGVTFNEAYKNKKSHNFDGLEANVMHINDLLKNKMSTDRSKDKIDIIELKKLIQKN